jgi:hypothetical protein
MKSMDEMRDELRAANERAEDAVRVDVNALRARGLRRSRSALGRLWIWLVIELTLNVLAMGWLGSFLAAHLGEPRFVVSALLLDAVALVQVIAAVRQLVGLRRVNLDGPLVPAQRGLERLRVERIRLTVATLLVAPLLWIPLLAVSVEAAFDADIFHLLPASWIVLNVLVGAAFVPAMLWLARRFADRFSGSPVVRRLLRDLAGHNLSAAQRFLAELGDVGGAEPAP